MIYIHTRKNFIDLFSKNSYVLCKFHVSFSTSRKKQPMNIPKTFDFLLQKHHFSPETVSKVASVLPHLKNTQKCDSILSFLKESGFSNVQLEKVVKHTPRFLAASLERKIKPKVKIFQDLGYSAGELADLISKDPWILHRGVGKMVCALSVLKGLMRSNAEVAKLLQISGWFLTRDLTKTLVPNVKLLESCDIPLERIVNIMYLFPRFLLNEPEVMRKSVNKADEMGVCRGCKMYIHAVRVISSMTDKTWEMKLKAFRDMGFSEDDILRAFRQAPPVFIISVKKMMKIKEIVLATGKYDISYIAKNPTFLCRSIEKWHKPRLQVLEVLERKKLITDWPAFTTMFKMSEKKFFEKFVGPYIDELGDVYLAKNAVK
ncbi:hypothetical protein CDL12_04869 [Handroanthus impetiginosus]|uniref:Mitochondrial transcription termination factor, mTERF n=1 Tax=Handroanthus impetiginosus TaxID=429701 RepID=A0A2G9HYK1_9LAMI|nr:hypothetical protein CDL12_04869 [Handroanthus impetiginosus]